MPLDENLLHAILETVLDGIVTADESGRILTVNPAVERLFGYTDDELVGQNVAMLMPEPYHSQHVGYMRRYIEGGEPRVMGQGRDVHGRRKDGSIFPLHLGVTETRLEGQRLFVGILKDQSARKAAERARDRFFEVSPDLLCTARLDGRFESLNAAWERVLGYPVAALLATPYLDLAHPDDVATTRDHLDCLARGQSLLQFNNRFRTRAGSWRCLEWNAVYVPTDKLIYAAARDITHQQEVQQLKDQLVGTVSHELRSPLSAVQGALQMLNRGLLGKIPEPAVELVTIALSNTERLVRLVTDLLDLDRMESGRVALELSNVDVPEVLDEVAMNLSTSAEQAGVQVEVAAEPGLLIQADRDRLVQVLVNLVSNALKFAPRGSQVRMEVHKIQGDAVRLTVLDSGPGIPVEHQQRIFERFEQVHTAERTHAKGTGLGLAICRAIVEQHGGAIGVDSRPGEGACFWVELPVRAVVPRR